MGNAEAASGARHILMGATVARTLDADDQVMDMTAASFTSVSFNPSS